MLHLRMVSQPERTEQPLAPATGPVPHTCSCTAAWRSRPPVT
jgi:hypothetical protein